MWSPGEAGSGERLRLTTWVLASVGAERQTSGSSCSRDGAVQHMPHMGCWKKGVRQGQAEVGAEKTQSAYVLLHDTTASSITSALGCKGGRCERHKLLLAAATTAMILRH